ncbi:MAG: Crp/Fnr family transcriptional regulator [Candidatus Saccharimonas sp.]
MEDILQISDSHRKFFINTGRRVEYPKGQIMSWPDDQQSWVYFLDVGFIRTSCSYADGSENVLGYLRPGSTFSQSSASFNHGGRLEMEFYATQDCAIYRVKVEDFWNELQVNQIFSNDYLVMQLRDEMMMVDHIIWLGEHDLERRFIRWALMMAKFYGKAEKEGGVIITVPQTQTEVAAWLSVRRETAGKMIRNFVASGHISLKAKCLRVTNLSQLEALL